MFKINTNNVFPGDIILTNNDSKYIGKLVLKATKGKFSHVRMCLYSSTYIHADREGVHTGEILRLDFKNKNEVSIIRPKDHSFIDKAVWWAGRIIGTKYSISDAVKTVYSKDKNVQVYEENRQFCSRFVAQAYANAGLNIVKDINFCFPEDISNSEYFIRISDFLFKPTKRQLENIESRIRMENRSKKVLNDVLKKIRKITMTDIQTERQITDFLCENPEYDEKVTNLYISSGYNDIFTKNYDKSPWLFDPQELIKHLSIDGASEDEIRKFLSVELENIKRRIEHYKKEINFFQNLSIKIQLLWSEEKMNHFSKLIAIQLDLMDSVVKAQSSVGTTVVPPYNPHQVLDMSSSDWEQLLKSTKKFRKPS